MSVSAPVHPEHDATGADAARVARAAGVGRLTLIHLNPAFSDQAPVLADAVAGFEHTTLALDGATLG